MAVHLRKLDLSYNFPSEMADGSWEDFAGEEPMPPMACPALEELSLFECCKVTDASVIALVQHCPSLKDVNFTRCRQITDASVTALAQHCLALAHVDLRVCEQITDALVTALAHHCPTLVDVGGWYNRRSDTEIKFESNTIDGLVIFFAQHFPALAHVDLKYCKQITDASVTALAQHCPALAHMGLVGCKQITDASVSMLRAKGCNVEK